MLAEIATKSVKLAVYFLKGVLEYGISIILQQFEGFSSVDLILKFVSGRKIGGPKNGLSGTNEILNSPQEPKS